MKARDEIWIWKVKSLYRSNSLRTATSEFEKYDLDLFLVEALCYKPEGPRHSSGG
jgi:hypothetical protein